MIIKHGSVEKKYYLFGWKKVHNLIDSKELKEMKTPTYCATKRKSVSLRIYLTTQSICFIYSMQVQYSRYMCSASKPIWPAELTDLVYWRPSTLKWKQELNHFNRFRFLIKEKEKKTASFCIACRYLLAHETTESQAALRWSVQKHCSYIKMRGAPRCIMNEHRWNVPRYFPINRLEAALSIYTPS